jgi:hypothetical protein
MTETLINLPPVQAKKAPRQKRSIHGAPTCPGRCEKTLPLRIDEHLYLKLKFIAVCTPYILS